MPHLNVEFAERVEARRLFWPIGYMRELGLALDQLQWLYDSPDMPWAFHYDESRHMWDEARHGDSGHARMQELGISIEDVGFTHPPAEDVAEKYPEPPMPLPPMSPKDLYEEMFFIGLVAETGHFKVKRQAYADFRDGGDLDSAEMMLYDIIDETTHVQYAHRWLPALARRAGIDHERAEKRAKDERRRYQEEHNRQCEKIRSADVRTPSPGKQKYRDLLERLRQRQPLTNADTCPLRDRRPM